MRKNKKRSCLILICILFLLTGCQTTQVEQKESNEVIVIPVMFRVDPEADQGQYKAIVEGFNEEFIGKYRVEVEWITATEQGYRDKVKVLNALDKLPVIITDVAFNAELYKNMMYNGRLVDLKPYMEQSEEWSELLSDVTMVGNQGQDGEIYLAPVYSGLYSSAGIYYNKKIFALAGIEEFPKTWEEFFLCLDKLKSYGVTPVALHGGDSYWGAMLIATAYMASEPEGKEFLEETLPDTYCSSGIDNMLKCMLKLYDYTWDDALEIGFSEAQERFCNGEVAMISNGFWMLEVMPEEVQEQTGFSTFPENCMMVSREMSGWGVVSGYDDEITQGAVEFLKYRYLHSQVNEQEDNELTTEYKRAFNNISMAIPNYQLKWKDSVQNDFFLEMMPKLLAGEVSREEFMRLMDEQ